MKPPYRVIAWEHVAVVDLNGDTRESVTIRVKVDSPDLRFIRFGFGCGWEQASRFRRQVKLEVRNLRVGNTPGASLSKTITWVKDGKLALIAHRPNPPRVDSEIATLVELTWPGKCAPLMRDGIAEKFTFRFVTEVAYARYKIVLPRSCEAVFEPVGFDETDDGCVCSSLGEDDEGRPQYIFEGVDMPLHRETGIRLELKRGSARR